MRHTGFNPAGVYAHMVIIAIFSQWTKKIHDMHPYLIAIQLAGGVLVEKKGRKVLKMCL